MTVADNSMSVERDIRYELVARLCPNATGAELKSVATEAGMFAIRARRKVATERDFLDAVEKVIRQGTKFSSTALYAQYVVSPMFGRLLMAIDTTRRDGLYMHTILHGPIHPPDCRGLEQLGCSSAR